MAQRSSGRRWWRGSAQWHLLPPEVMCRVFQHLPDRERCWARLACCAWNKVFHTPQLWRERSFSFRGFHQDEGWCAARYMQTLGSHLRHLEVEISMPVVQNARVISLAVETFLNTKARGLRLKTFTCSGLEFFQTPLYRIARHRVRMIRALCNFLRRQRSLERVSLACSQMGREDGARVLKALAFHCRALPNKTPVSNLHSLELGDFFLEDLNVAELPAFQEEIGKFVALRHLGLNFTYINDTVLLRLAQSLTALESLALSVDGSQLILIAHMAENNLMASPAGWRTAALLRSRLRVLVDIRGRFRLIDFQRVLVPCMPLGALSVTSLISSLFFGPEEMLGHVASLMDYLSEQFYHTLHAFHLGWFDLSTIWTHKDPLVRLVRACPSLRYLSLAMTFPLDTVLQVAAAATHCSEQDPLQVYVAGFDNNIGSAALQAKLSARRSKCVVHAGKPVLVVSDNFTGSNSIQ